MKKKIFHITYGLDIGGIESHFLFLAQNNKLFNFDHYFVAISKKGLVFNQIEKIDKKKLFFINIKLTKINFFFITFKFLFLIKENKPYKIHLYGNDICLYLGIVSLIFKINYICEIIGETKFKNITKSFLNIVYQNANKIICVSKKTKLFFVENFLINKKNIIIRNPPVKVLNLYNIPTLNTNACSLIYIGRFEEVKNLKNLIKAFKIFQNNNKAYSLILLGDGHLKKELIRMIGNKNKKIKIMNKTLNLENYLTNINFVINPSYSEGFGLSILELMNIGIVPIMNVNLPLFDKKYSIPIKGFSYTDIIHSLNVIKDLSEEEYILFQNNCIKVAKNKIIKINSLNNYEFYY